MHASSNSSSPSSPSSCSGIIPPASLLEAAPPQSSTALQHAYAQLNGSHPFRPLTISPAAVYHPAALLPPPPPAPHHQLPTPPHTFSPARDTPPDHQYSLFSAVESARWAAGDFSSLSSAPSQQQLTPPYAFSAPALPPPPPPAASGNALGLVNAPAFSHLPDEATVGHALAAVPSLGGSSSGNAPQLTRSDADFEATLGYQSRVKPFVQKLAHLLSRPDAYADTITWDSEGKAFVVHHCKRFHAEVLPKMFGHTNSASFTRQLNVYGFRRLTNAELCARIDVPSTQDYSGWIHDQFTRGDRASLHLLTPRPSRARLAKREEKERQTAGEDVDEAQIGGHRVGDRERRASRDSQGSQSSGSTWSTPLVGSQPLFHGGEFVEQHHAGYGG